jgi:hypothetical protein
MNGLGLFVEVILPALELWHEVVKDICSTGPILVRFPSQAFVAMPFQDG